MSIRAKYLHSWPRVDRIIRFEIIHNLSLRSKGVVVILSSSNCQVARNEAKIQPSMRNSGWSQATTWCILADSIVSMWLAALEFEQEASVITQLNLLHRKHVTCFLILTISVIISKNIMIIGMYSRYSSIAWEAPGRNTDFWNCGSDSEKQPTYWYDQS